MADMPEINDVVVQPPTLQTTRYASPKTKQEIAKARKSSVPFTTHRDRMWCLGVWKDGNRNSRTDTNSSKVPSNPAAAQFSCHIGWRPLFWKFELKNDSD